MKIFINRSRNFLRFVKHKLIIRAIHNLHIFIVKKLSLKSKMLNIDIGAGSTIKIFNDFLCTDIHNFNILDEEKMSEFLGIYKIKNVIAEHIFEHLTQDEMRIAFKQLNKFMEIGSRIRVAVPDGFNPSQEYIDNVNINGSGPGADDHKQLLNYKKINEIFNDMPSFKIYFIEFFDERNIFNTKNYANIGREITRSSFSKTFNKSFHLSHLSLIFDVVKVKQN